MGQKRPKKRQPEGAIERVHGGPVRRMTLYLPVEVAHALRIYCAHVDMAHSDVVTEAVTRLLADPLVARLAGGSR